MSFTLQVDKGTAGTNRSSTIASGGTAQTLMAANPLRSWFWVQNLSSEDLYINEIGTATAGGNSIKIAAGALYECPYFAVSKSAISIIGATTGSAFSAREY